MYLNKTAELTEQIILVPHIIEMSCRITQRKGDKDAFLQTPEMSLASFAFFPFPNYWTAKSSRCNWKLSKRVSMMARAAFVAVLMSVEVWNQWILLEASQQTGSGDAVWLQINFEVHPEKSCFFFIIIIFSRRMLPLLGHLPSCLWGHLLV